MILETHSALGEIFKFIKTAVLKFWHVIMVKIYLRKTEGIRHSTLGYDAAVNNFKIVGIFYIY